MADIIPILSKPESLESTIREIARDSVNVSFIPAQEKGIAGDVAMSQVWRCLEEGSLIGEAIVNEYGDYLCELRVITAGQEIYLTVAVDTKNVRHKTITVLHISEG